MLRSLLQRLADHGEVIRVDSEVDPYLDLAEITRRVYQVGGPGLWFQNVKGSPFSAVSNLFGTETRAEQIFGHAWARMAAAVRLKSQGMTALVDGEGVKSWGRLLRAGWNSLPRYDRMAARRHHHIWSEISLAMLPQQVSWPQDGGAFITLPQVLSVDPFHPKIMTSNLGMYRIQISGGEYEKDRQAGLHYQLHRGIGIHHSLAQLRAQKTGKPWKVSVFMGGHPAFTLAAVMPLPEGMSELTVAGILSGRRARWYVWNGYHILSDADFCILGEVDLNHLKPEGPFGDHLGYYSLIHDFPFMNVKHVLHKKDAVMPMTVVGRPPQEDTSFGRMIHRISSPMVPVSLPGVKEVHAVDEAGVHPLLLAIGSERYVPYQPLEPREIITQGFAILGFNQCSLAKYLIMATQEDDPHLSTHDIRGFLTHVLMRMNLRRDIHILTQTPLDTLDYTSQSLNRGSKALIVGVGEPIRLLDGHLPQSLDGMTQGHMVTEGIAAVTLEEGSSGIDKALLSLKCDLWEGVPWLVVCDDASVLAGSIREFVWNTFTKSHPADDLRGRGQRFERKHWVFDGPLVIDATTKSHHPPVLKPCEQSVKRVDKLICQEPNLRQWLG